MAQAEAAENPEATEPLKELARVRARDAEVGAHEIFEKHGFACPISIDTVDLAPTKQHCGFPYMKFSKWVKYLLDSGRLSRQLCACADLESMKIQLREFWARYQSIFPSHQIFGLKESGQVQDLGLVIPVFSHTDEGRSYKKAGIWLLSTHGALGRGTRGYLKKGKDKLPLKRNSFGLNFCGHTWSTHYMFACMLRKVFKKKPQVLDDLVKVYSQDMEDLLLNGVWDSTGTINIKCCHLGTKGDLPALTRMGNMKYSFGNVPKAASSRKPCEGLCWMCFAGREANPTTGATAVPFEDVSGKPAWEATLGQVDAWDETPALLQGVPMLESDQWQFYKTDLWHNFHLGIAKHWVASSLVSMLENLTLPFGNMDEKIAWLGKEYKDFCQRKRLSPHCDELGRETLSWYQSSNCPKGTWNKGSQSTHYMMFLEDFCKNHADQITGEPLLETIVPRFTLCIFSHQNYNIER